MARPLPNPVSSLEKGQLDTLRDALYQQTETQKWSKNVDINTFRTQQETEAGFESLSDGFAKSNKNFAIAIQQGADLKKNLDPKEQESVWEGLHKGLGDIFGAITGPLHKLGAAIDGFQKPLSDTSPMETFQLGASQFGRGFKELTNGIGAMGPVMNTFKTAFYKFTAVINVLGGALRIVISLVKGIIKGFVFLIKGIYSLITNFKETWGKMKEAVAGFAGAVTDKVKGWFGFEKEEKKEDKSKEQDSESAEAAEVLEVLKSSESLLHMLAHGEAKELSPEDKEQKAAAAEDEFSKGMAKIAEEEEAEKEAARKKEEKVKKEFAKAKKEEEKRLRKERHKAKMFQLKQQGLAFTKNVLAPFMLIIAALFLLWKAWENWEPLAGMTVAIKEAGKRMLTKVSGVFTAMTTTLSKKFPRLFGGLAKTVPAATIVDDAAKAGGKIVAETGKKGATVVDDVVKSGKDVLKKGGAEVVEEGAKKGTSKLATGLKVVGKAAGPVAAIAEAGMDWSEQNQKFARIQHAYETGEKVDMPTGDGGTEKRAITEQEFELMKRAHTANRAGSVGKGGGSLAAASAAATVAAPLIVAPFPGARLLYGAIVIGSAIAGGWAGDKTATNLVEGGEIDDAQELIDNMASKLPPIDLEALQPELKGEDMKELNENISDEKASNQGSSGINNNLASSINVDSSSNSTYVKEQDMDDGSWVTSYMTPYQQAMLRRGTG